MRDSNACPVGPTLTLGGADGASPGLYRDDDGELVRVPLYCAPPSTENIRQAMRVGQLGTIVTPAQGNALEERYWWCADNGIFGGTYPGDEPYLRWLDRLPYTDRCLFAVAPDTVGNHWATLARSRSMLPRIRALGYPVAFVAQDGLQWSADHLWDDIDCLFIGGSTAFKLSPQAAELISIANSLGLWTHMGRVNSWRRYHYAAAIGCKSVDGTGLTYAPDKNLPQVQSWRRRVLSQSALPSI
ncbi:hypothetical protein [Streptosporangium sandarakinum]|uniref:hypothetical protein n=1 Tax=Streptosporangium sandarakinum TaxID=1260955 RepID=UPI0037A48CFB